MLIYEARPRVYRFAAAEEPTLNWPVEATIHFYFQPMQPFGMAAGGGRTAVRGSAASSYFNANTGVHSIESNQPLKPLEVRINDPARTLSLDGNTLTVAQTFESWEILNSTIESIYVGFPVFLNVTFADAPFIERVDGAISGVNFRWELAEWNMECQITTQTLQEKRIVQAWQRMPLFANANRRTLLAALHYFHVACRLNRAGEAPGEFLPEVLLNLAKTLEALFPPAGNGSSLNAARSGLKQLGFDDAANERDFFPQ